jgi:MFS family permease
VRSRALRRPGPWGTVVALLIVTFAIANPFSAFGVFLPVFVAEFGWSRGAISLAMSINLLLGGAVGFVIGTIADRRGPRAPLVMTVALAGLGFGLASAVRELWQLYVCIGVMGGIGLSGFYVLTTATVSRWFNRHRGLALGVVLTGFNLGFMTGGPIAAFLIERSGWRVAWLVLGGGFCLVGVAAGALVTYPPGTVTTAGARWAGLGPALGDWRLWALTVAWLLVGGVLLMISVHIVPFARDRGVSLEAASFALTAYGLGAVLGRLGGGAAADRFGMRPTMAVCTVAQVIALAPLLARPSEASLLALLALFGAGFAGADTVFVRMVPEVFGIRSVAGITGIIAMGWRWGAALGPAVAGFVHDATGSYAIPFAAAPVAVIASFAIYVVATRRRTPGEIRPAA